MNFTPIKRQKKTKTRMLPMEEMQNRPCKVNGRPALFHRWVEEDNAMLKINTYTTPEESAQLAKAFKRDWVCVPGCSTEVIRRTFALVEYQDGTVDMVDPLFIQFSDKEGTT